VANPTNTEKEYALMARISRESAVISEEVLPVFGYSWFKVAPGDLVRLRGALRFDESDSELALLLVEKETEEVADAVVTVLVSPVNANALPPSWPGTGVTSSSDWSTMLAMMLPVMMIGMIGAATTPKKEEKVVIPEREGVKLLPPGREE
jgi:hypothetical protein